MDLLKAMKANRETAGLINQVQAMTITKTKPKKEELAPGTKAMRMHIIEEKPGKKVVKEHFEAIIAQECESSSDSD